MPGFDKMGAYRIIDSTDNEEEFNLQCTNQIDDTDNVEGMY